MDVSRRPRPLLVALGLSFLLHLALLPFVRSYAAAKPAREQRAGHMTISLASPTPRPIPPTPLPAPRTTTPSRTTPTIVPVHQRRVTVSAPHVRSRASSRSSEPRVIGRNDTPIEPNNGVIGTPNVVAAPPIIETAAPTTEPIAVPSACANAAHDATVVNAVTPDRPSIAAAEGAVGRVEVRVDLNARGTVVAASVYHSSGNEWLDEAAKGAALHARYAAATDGCKPIGGSYLYTVDFSD